MSNARLSGEQQTAVTCQATVTSSERTTPEDTDEIRRLVIDVHATDVDFCIGESIGVLPPRSVQPGKKHILHYYSVDDLPSRNEQGKPRITVHVRRWPVSKHAPTPSTSNYLCDLKPGDALSISGPFGIPFEVPAVPDANLILIGTGSGISPFRAFVRHIHQSVPEWKGRIWLFYGARSGLEYLYINEKADITQFYNESSYEAFKALCPRPNWADPIAWDLALAERGEELLEMLAQPSTYVYVAGLHQVSEKLDSDFSELTGSAAEWARIKAELAADNRWVELLY